jgi:ribosome maturation protein SDO1
MTIDPVSGHRHTTGMIEKAMTEINYVIKADKPAKAQALELIRKLQAPESPLQVQRVRMRVRITMPSKDAKRVKDKVLAEVEEVEEEDMGAEWEAIVKLNPAAYRSLTDLVNDETKGKGRVESMGSAAT